MKAEDLQLGNYVSYKGTIIKIEAIHAKKIGYHTRPDRLTWVRISMLEPIKLNTFIIERNFAFNHEYTSTYGNGEVLFYKFGYKSWNLVWLVEQEVLKIEDDPLITVVYVHELQNLCKLTGTHIEIII